MAHINRCAENINTVDNIGSTVDTAQKPRGLANVKLTEPAELAISEELLLLMDVFFKESFTDSLP